MTAQPRAALVDRLAIWELGLACRLGRELASQWLLLLLVSVSRIGDWALSVGMGLVLLVARGPRAMLLWTAASLGAVVLQKLLKRHAGRLRPCQHPGGPPQRAPIPDHGSFPSGHTLHAVMAATVAARAIPMLAAPLAVLALLIATSRVALGVHYPSDVVAGGAIGAVVGIVLCSLL